MIQPITQKIQPCSDYFSPRYSVKDRVFYSKLAALTHCDRHGVSWPTFRVWNHEQGYARPLENFWQLAVGAAEQLAREHSAVRLWYSGGSDSHAVLEAMLQAGHAPVELAMYRRFIGALDDTVNVEVDVFPVKQFAVRTMQRYGKKIDIRVYDIMPEHFAWYMQDPGQRWFRHKTCWPTSMNPVICHEVYSELQTDGVVNVGGGATPTVHHNSFHWVDADFNLNFMTPRNIHFFCDPRWPQLAAAYAYGIWDCRQQGIASIGQIKKHLGFPPLENMLDSKWIWPQVNGSLLLKNDWRHCKKEQLLLANGFLSDQGMQTLDRMQTYLMQLGTNTRWFNQGDIFQDYVGAASEEHLLEDLL